MSDQTHGARVHSYRSSGIVRTLLRPAPIGRVRRLLYVSSLVLPVLVVTEWSVVRVVPIILLPAVAWPAKVAFRLAQRYRCAVLVADGALGYRGVAGPDRFFGSEIVLVRQPRRWFVVRPRTFVRVGTDTEIRLVHPVWRLNDVRLAQLRDAIAAHNALVRTHAHANSASSAAGGPS